MQRLEDAGQLVGCNEGDVSAFAPGDDDDIAVPRYLVAKLREVRARAHIGRLSLHHSPLNVICCTALLYRREKQMARRKTNPKNGGDFLLQVNPLLVRGPDCSCDAR